MSCQCSIYSNDSGPLLSKTLIQGIIKQCITYFLQMGCQCMTYKTLDVQNSFLLIISQCVQVIGEITKQKVYSDGMISLKTTILVVQLKPKCKLRPIINQVGLNNCIDPSSACNNHHRILIRGTSKEHPENHN